MKKDWLSGLKGVEEGMILVLILFLIEGIIFGIGFLILKICGL